MRARPLRSPRSRRARNARVRRSALGRMIPPGPVCLIALSVPAATQRADQLPLAHFRAAGDVVAFGELVELLAVSLLQRPAVRPPCGRVRLRPGARDPAVSRRADARSSALGARLIVPLRYFVWRSAPAWWLPSGKPSFR